MRQHNQSVNNQGEIEMNNIPEKHDDEIPAYRLIKQIKEGSLDPKNLSAEQRQDCVEALRMEGQSYPSIAQLLERNEKTIKRDWEAICKRNSKKPSPEYALRLIGELIEKASAKGDHLTRLSHSKEGSIQEKAQAEYYAWKVLQEASQLLQSAGYLPHQPTRIEGEVHHYQEDRSPVQLKEEIARVEKIINEEGKDNPVLKEKLEVLKQKVEEMELRKQINDLADQVNTEANNEGALK